MKNTADKGKLLFAMLIFGTIGVLRRYLPYSSALIALVRGCTGSLFLAAVLFLKKEKLPRQAWKKNLPLLALSGVLIGGNWILLFEAYRFTSVSVATVCYYMASVMVLAASPLLLHEKLTLRSGLCALFSLAGVVLTSGVFETGFTGLRGILFGLGAAVLYAAVILLNKRIRNLTPDIRTLFQLLSAALVLLPYVLLTEDLTKLSGEPLPVCLLLIAGILHTGIAYTLYFGSIGRLPAQTVAILSYLDPATAVLLSVTVLGETPTLPTAAGIALVLGAAVLSELPRRKRQENAGKSA